MDNKFSSETVHEITEANINYYATPFVHPKRIMADHDFIYMLDGEWKIGQNDEIFELKRDTLLILSGDNLHYGASACLTKSKTMYFHVKSEKIDELTPDIILPSLFRDCGRNVKKIFSEVVRSMLSGNQRRANLYFEILLTELYESLRSRSKDSISAKIRNMIHDNPEIFLSNVDLARSVSFSVKTAENKFKESYGMSIHKYILDFKIKEAISTFEVFPEMIINEISYNLGFYDEYHVSKQFNM